MKKRRRGPPGGTAHRVVRGRQSRLRAACGFGGAKAGSLRTERCTTASGRTQTANGSPRDHPPQPG